MQLSVMLFASYADAFGRDRLAVEIPDGSSVAELVDILRAQPEGTTLPPKPLVAVNRRYAEYSEPITSSDEVAVIPPVAGG